MSRCRSCGGRRTRRQPVRRSHMPSMFWGRALAVVVMILFLAHWAQTGSWVG